MGLRAYWSGDLAVGPLTIPVQAGPMIGADERDEQLKRLCSCHHQPFTRDQDHCPGGSHPWSQAAEDRGDKGLADVVYGTPKEFDDETGDVLEWAVLDNDKLAEIKEAAQLEDLEVGDGDVVSVWDIPFHLATGQWYVWPQLDKKRKAEARLKQFAALVRALDKRELALVTLWQGRITSRPRLVVLHAIDGALVMNALPFLPEVRPAEAKITSHAAADVPGKQVEMTGDLLAALQGEFEYGAYEDETIALRRKAIDEALAGEPVTKRERPALAVVEDEDDEAAMMAQLEASLKLVKSGQAQTRSRRKVAA